MERIWASWRMAYIRDAVEGGDTPDVCIFCALPGEGDDEKALILERLNRAFTVMNAFPYNTAHVMVAPFDHVGEVEDISAEVAAEMHLLTQRASAAIRAAYNPDGMNLGANLGRIAGAGFPGHFHVHIVPRWSGDTNFMPVVGNTKVIPEGLDETYSRLRAALGDLPPP